MFSKSLKLVIRVAPDGGAGVLYKVGLFKNESIGFGGYDKLHDQAWDMIREHNGNYTLTVKWD